jgi:hypothetical protein
VAFGIVLGGADVDEGHGLLLEGGGEVGGLQRVDVLGIVAASYKEGRSGQSEREFLHCVMSVFSISYIITI